MCCGQYLAAAIFPAHHTGGRDDAGYRPRDPGTGQVGARRSHNAVQPRIEDIVPAVLRRPFGRQWTEWERTDAVVEQQ